MPGRTRLCHTAVVRDPRAAGLAVLLEGHRPAAEDEAGLLARVRELLSVRERPFDRDGFTPGHLTASGFVVDRERSRVVLIHHRRLGIWIQPGGHVDARDPSPEAAARREIAEETGLAMLQLLEPALFDVDVHRYPARGGEPAHEHFDLRFAYLAGDDWLRPNDEVHEARWVDADGLAALGVDRSILRPAAKLLRAL